MRVLVSTVVLSVVLWAGCSSPETTNGDDAAQPRDGGGDDAALDGGLVRDANGGVDAGCQGVADHDGDGDRSVACGGQDCDDDDATRSSAATEVCDVAGVDEDCDPTTFGMRDSDGDGYLDRACCNGTSCGDDCNDQNPSAHPTGNEACNGQDDDCDGAIDEGVQITFYADCDGDGIGAGTPMPLCTPSMCAGFPAVTSNSDCDNSRPEAHPGAPETCNGMDEDCDMTVDEDVANTFYADCDGDGYGAGAAISGCMPAPCMGHPAVTTASDCDDTHASAHPGGNETCNGADDDCSGTADDGSADASCPPVSNGTPACIAGVCGAGSCAPGRHVCSSVCVLNTDVATCGSSCTPCVVGSAHAHATCDGTHCATVCDPGFSMIGSMCDVRAPRPIAPMSTSMATTRRPTLRWSLGASSDGAHIEICSDRACTTVLQTLDVTGTSARPTSDLPHGLVFWRLFGRSGSATGTTPSPVWELFVPVLSSSVDSAWGTTPDVNGDGYSDLVVGAAQGPANPGGLVYVYHGGPSGIGTTAARTLSGPDGGAFGASVASAGDVNGDGYTDVIVGAPAVMGGLGAAYVYLGSATGLATSPATRLLGPSMGSALGFAVAGVGDINRDGYGDVVIGAWQISLPGGGRGRAFVHLGGATGTAATPASTLSDPTGGLDFGRYVQTAGDVNGDGYADVAVGSNTTGHIYLGSATGLSTTWTAIAGIRSGYPGDVNGDGYTDVIAGAHDLAGGTSGTYDGYVYLGSSAGIPTTPTVTLPGILRLSSAGDVNGDGYDDVVSANRPNLYLGSAAGVSMTGTTAFSDTSVTTATGIGDVNRDGFADVVFAYPFNAQNVNVFLGRAGTPATIPTPALTSPAGTAEGFGFSVARATCGLDDGERAAPVWCRSADLPG